MAKVDDIARMQRRVTATEAKLSAAAKEGRNRNARLSDLLDAIEKNLAQKRRQISDLEREHDRALEEVQHLRNLLHIMLSMAENTHQREPHLAFEDSEKLIDRLGAVGSAVR